MAEGDLAEALRRLMERGWRTGDPTRGDMAGLRDLMDRLERRREEMLERYQLDDVLGDIRRELDEIVAEERAGVERRLDAGVADADGDEPSRTTCAQMLRDVAARRLDQLDALPPDVGERIRGLQDYDFLEPARARAVRRARRAAPGPGPRPVRGRDVRRDPVDDARRTSPPTARWSATSTS